MNWKVRLVLLFARFRQPIDAGSVTNLIALRQKSDRAAWLGSLLFDRKLPVKHLTDTHADGVPVRIYRNSSRSNQRVIIYYHGGGFVLYGIYSHDLVCRRLCRMNDCIVVSVGYRLAPEHPWPAAHNDAFIALRWVKQHITSYGGHAEDLVVAGDSAGGNLAACMAHRCKKENIALKAQVLIYPWIDGRLNNPSITRNGKGYLLEKSTVFWFQDQYTSRPEDRCLPELSPCFESDFTQLAPAFVLTAEFDPLLDDGYRYFEQLKQAGNPAHYRQYAQLFHGFFSLPFVHPLAQQAYAEIRDFLQRV